MDFNEFSWAAVCFYYRSVGDKKYGKLMRNKDFLVSLRETPSDLSTKEFEEQVILDHINIENYDVLLRHNLAGNILARIVELHPEISTLQNTTILDCDLSNTQTKENIIRIYLGLSTIRGLWITGVSKIMHLLNDKLFAMLNPILSDYFAIPKSKSTLIEWLRLVQIAAREVTYDFNRGKYSGTPELFISEKLGYTSEGYQKSLVKYLDEYFWLRFSDNLPVPPKWIPTGQSNGIQLNKEMKGTIFK